MHVETQLCVDTLNNEKKTCVSKDRTYFLFRTTETKEITNAWFWIISLCCPSETYSWLFIYQTASCRIYDLTLLNDAWNQTRHMKQISGINSCIERLAYVKVCWHFYCRFNTEVGATVQSITPPFVIETIATVCLLMQLQPCGVWIH